MSNCVEKENVVKEGWTVSMIKDKQKIFNALLKFLDFKNLILAAGCTWMLKFYTDTVFAHSAANSLMHYLAGGVILGICIIFAYSASGLYGPMRGQRFWTEAVHIFQANVICFSILLAGLFVLKLTEFSRTGLLLFLSFSILFSITERAIIRRALKYIRKKGYNQKHILVVGTGQPALHFYRRVLWHREFGLNIMGFLGEPIEELKVLGPIGKLEEFLRKGGVDEVVVAISLEEYKELAAIIYTCEKFGVKTLIIPDYLQYIPARPQIIEFEDIPLINIREVPLDTLPNLIIKRTMDIILSLLFIIISAPVMITVAAGVKLTSPGPVVFMQERLGLGGRPFMIYKFRSMHMASDNSANTRWTVPDDPRRTRFGEFIRATSLDELPQFFNVLLGDMSIIGPRPERPFFVGKFKEEIPKYMVKHQVKPGITGWAQVNGWRGDTSIPERIKCDLYYIENWSVWLDLKILFLTGVKGISNKNAY
jgi:Undecaprenyl-phosphate glucose phosphotransferase